MRLRQESKSTHVAKALITPLENTKPVRITNTTLTNQANDPPAKPQQTTTTTSSGSEQANMGVGLYAVILIGGALAFAAYQYLQASSTQQKA